jgi:hypothetical protein
MSAHDEAGVAKPRNRKRRQVALFCAGLLVAGGAGAVATGALWNTTKSVTGNTFSTGTVDLNATPSSVMTSAAMMPGDAVYGKITVTNSGSDPMRYALQGKLTTGNKLGTELRVGVKTIVSGTCDATAYAGGTTRTTADLAMTTAGAKIFGDAAQGNQTTPNGGDVTLAPAASEILCVKVSLPTTADTLAQGLSDTLTFQFDAEQTKNNA